MIGFLLTILMILVVASIVVQIVRIYRKQIKQSSARDMTSAFELCPGSQEEEDEEEASGTTSIKETGAKPAWTVTTTQMNPLQPQNHNEYVNMAEETAVV
jgi:hypothetical protein